MMGEKITQTMALEVWNLETPAVMFECLADLVDQGYRGELKSYTPQTNLPAAAPVLPVWLIELNADDKPSVTATLGQTVVMFGGTLEAMTSEAYEVRFGG